MTSGGGTVPYRGSPGSKYTFDSRFTLTSPTLHGGARAGSGAVVVVVGTVVGAVVGAVVVVVARVVDVFELSAAVRRRTRVVATAGRQTDEPDESYESRHRHHRRRAAPSDDRSSEAKVGAPGQCKDGRMDIELVLDCADLDRMTAFWTEALGYEHTGSAAQSRGPPRPRRPAAAPPVAASRRAEVREEPDAHRPLGARHRGRGQTRLETLGANASAEWAPGRARDRVDPDARPRGQRGLRLQAVRRHERPARAGCRPALHVRPRPRGPTDPIAQALIDETAALGLVCRMQIAPEQGDLMRMHQQLDRRTQALEVGTFTGYSALCVARGPPRRRHTALLRRQRGVDEHRSKVLDESRRHVKDRPPDRAGHRHLRVAFPPGKQFDLTFIDADKPSYATYYDEIIPSSTRTDCSSSTTCCGVARSSTRRRATRT